MQKNMDLNPPEPQAVTTRYRAILKSSESFESKGYIAVCSPDPFITVSHKIIFVLTLYMGKNKGN